MTETEIKIVNGAAPLASKKDRGERAKEEKRRKQRGKKKWPVLQKFALTERKRVRSRGKERGDWCTAVPGGETK